MRSLITMILFAFSAAVFGTPLGSVSEGQFAAANVDLDNEPWIPADSQTPDPTFAALYAYNALEYLACDESAHNAALFGPFGNTIHSIQGQRALPTSNPGVADGLFPYTGQWYNRVPAGATSGNQYTAKFSGGLRINSPLLGGIVACYLSAIWSPILGIEVPIGYLGS